MFAALNLNSVLRIDGLEALVCMLQDLTCTSCTFIPFRLRNKAVYTDMNMDFWMTITTQTMIQTMGRNGKRSRESQDRELSKSMLIRKK